MTAAQTPVLLDLDVGGHLGSGCRSKVTVFGPGQYSEGSRSASPHGDLEANAGLQDQRPVRKVLHDGLLLHHQGAAQNPNRTGQQARSDQQPGGVASPGQQVPDQTAAELLHFCHGVSEAREVRGGEPLDLDLQLLQLFTDTDQNLGHRREPAEHKRVELGSGPGRVRSGHEAGRRRQLTISPAGPGRRPLGCRCRIAAAAAATEEARLRSESGPNRPPRSEP